MVADSSAERSMQLARLRPNVEDLVMAASFDTFLIRLARLTDGSRARGGDALRRLRRRLATGGGAVLLGLAALAFAKAGDTAQALFARLVVAAPYAPLLLTPALFAAVVYVTGRWFPAARGSGIPQVIAAARDPQHESTGPLVSLRTALAKVGLTLAMLLGGGSVGREGPTVQLSAAVMVWISRVLRVPIGAGVLIAGGAAGVAAAFNTPLAGVAFAIEELASAYEQRVAVLVMAAVMIAGLVSLGIAGDYVYFGTPEEYRQRYGLKADYPMVAPNYSESRRAMAHKIGLGRKAGAAVEKAGEVVADAGATVAKTARKGVRAAKQAAQAVSGS